MPGTSTEVTHLLSLREWSDGNPQAHDNRILLVIAEMCYLAKRALALESPAHTL